MVRTDAKKHTPIHPRSKENVEKLKYNGLLFTTFLKHFSDLATLAIPEIIPADEIPGDTENVNQSYSRGVDSKCGGNCDIVDKVRKVCVW